MKPEEKKARGIIEQEVLALLNSFIEQFNYPNLWLAQTIANADLMGVIDTLTECIANEESMKDIEEAIERAARSQADDMLWTSDEIAEVTMNEEDDQRL